jgi:hypothetical protein
MTAGHGGQSAHGSQDCQTQTCVVDPSRMSNASSCDADAPTFVGFLAMACVI